MISSRKLEDLHPTVREYCERFILACDDAGVDVIITSTFRDEESQNALFAQGRSRPGKRITNARGGDSFHQYRVAFDFAPVLNGKIDWNDTKLWKICGEIAEGIGLEWGGNWTKFKDLPHCQYTEGLTLNDFKTGKTLP